jgi:hypothetical protein
MHWIGTCIFGFDVCDYPHRFPLVAAVLIAPMSVIVACCRKDRVLARRDLGFAIDILVMTAIIWWGGYWN